MDFDLTPIEVIMGLVLISSRKNLKKEVEKILIEEKNLLNG